MTTVYKGESIAGISTKQNLSAVWIGRAPTALASDAVTGEARDRGLLWNGVGGVVVRRAAAQKVLSVDGVKKIDQPTFGKVWVQGQSKKSVIAPSTYFIAQIEDWLALS
ncbi:MAG: hypothetical protein RLZZ288_677 [Planctomycetota bacterium]